MVKRTGMSGGGNGHRETKGGKEYESAYVRIRMPPRLCLYLDPLLNSTPHRPRHLFTIHRPDDTRRLDRYLEVKRPHPSGLV